MMQRICDTSEITESGREFRIDEERGAWFLMIFRRGEHLVAYRNACPHRFLSLSWAPDRFMVGDDGLLVCPHHGAAFDLDSGICVQGPCSGDELTAVPISIDDGAVWLNKG